MCGLPPYLESGHLHLAYEYLYAQKLLMSRSDHQEFEHDISAAVDSYFDLGSKGRVEVLGKTTISFEAADGFPAAFAYKAGGLRCDSGMWSFYPGRSDLARRPCGPPPAGDDRRARRGQPE